MNLQCSMIRRDSKIVLPLHSQVIRAEREKPIGVDRRFVRSGRVEGEWDREIASDKRKVNPS